MKTCNKQKKKEESKVYGTCINLKFVMQKQIRFRNCSSATAVWFELPELILSRLLAFLVFRCRKKKESVTPLTSLECKYKKAAFYYEDQLKRFMQVLQKLSPVVSILIKVTEVDLIFAGKTTHGMVTKDLGLINVSRTSGSYRMFENALD